MINKTHYIKKRFGTTDHNTLLLNIPVLIWSLKCGCRDLCSCSHMIFNEVRHWCQVRRFAVQSLFQFIPKVFIWVENRVLRRLFQFIHINHGKTWLNGAHFVHCYTLCHYHARTDLGLLVSVKGSCNTATYNDIKTNASNFMATAWGRTTYFCHGQVHKLLAV